MHLFKFHVELESDNINSGDDALDELYRLIIQPLDDEPGFDYGIEGYGYLGSFGTPAYVCEVLISADDLDSAQEALESHIFVEEKPGLVVKYALA